MAALSSNTLTLADVARRTDPDGTTADIAELLHQTNPIIDDVPWMPSNLPTGHRSTIRTELPTVSLRRVNQGIASTKSTTAQITDGMSRMESWSTCDTMLLEYADSPADAMKIRLGEAEAHIEAHGQKFSDLLFSGSEADDEREFNGLKLRYGSLGDQVLNCDDGSGTSGTFTSIWLVGWAPNKVFGIYPRGSTAGLRHTDRGIQTEQTSNALGGTKMLAYEDVWCWDAGLVVKDQRFVVRLANIEEEYLKTLATSQDLTQYGTAIIYQMATAMHRIPNLQSCMPCFYMARSAFEGFDRMALAKVTNNVFKTEDVQGKVITTFRGVPCKIVDKLDFSESTITV